MKRASKGYTGVDIPLFLTMLVQGPILQGEGSTILVESHHTPSGAPTTSQPLHSSPSRILTKQKTKVPQPSSLTHTHVADKAAFTCVDVRHGGAVTTVSSLDAGQGSGNIDKTPSMPHDSPFLRVNTLGSDGESMTLNELTVLCINLSQKVDNLEADLKQTKQVYESAYTKLIMKVKRLEKTVKSSQVRRRAKIVVSNDEKLEDPSKQGRSIIKEIDQDAEVTLVTFTKVSTQREAQSQKSHPEDQLGVLSAAKVLTDAAKVHTYTRRRKAISTASSEISIAEELVSTAGASMPISTAGMVDKGKAIMQEFEPELTTIKLQQRQERAGYEAAKFDRVNLIKLWDLVKERFSTTEPTDDKEKELWVELKRLFEPDTEDELWKLHKHMHDPLTWRLYDTCGVYHVSTEKGIDIFMLIEKVYLL
nr:hypothetical protein [Tanacetum cinerariifolium]